MSPPPLVCPHGPHGQGPDCPLWFARARVRFQKSIEADSAAHFGISALVFADIASRGFQRPSIPPTRPVPVAVPSMPVLPQGSSEPVARNKKGFLKDA